ncbi:MAG: fumarate hydratase [Nitrospirae bacterium]|jgi:fumarate hydratase class I|nr:fumarate hydratase [Nitrospirota bacterium]
MLKLRDILVELYRETATSLPYEIETKLKKIFKIENSNAKEALKVILENIKMAREFEKPICQDTGVPIFFIKAPFGISHNYIKNEIIKATRIATRNIPLRANAVDVLTDKNSGDNTGIGFPVIYIEEVNNSKLIIELILKGSGSENIGQIYKLPIQEIGAERDFDGVRKCVLDAIYKAQGRGCPPYFIGIGIGATKDQVTRLSKEQLLREIEDKNKNSLLDALEKKILKDINKLGIGPMGFKGKTTALAVKIGINHRHPASYFVDVSISCWAHRKSKVILKI